MKPTCKKCGEQHWYFVKCADAPARNKIEERNETVKQINVQPQWSSNRDREWGGDRLTTLSRTPGTSTYFRKDSDAY